MSRTLQRGRHPVAGIDADSKAFPCGGAAERRPPDDDAGSGLHNVEVAAENGDGGLARAGALKSGAALQTGDSGENRRLRLGINAEGREVRNVEQIIEVEAHVGTRQRSQPILSCA